MCHRICQLYPQLREIQYTALPGNHVSFQIIPQTILDAKIVSEIQQTILTEISNQSEYKCSNHYIQVQKPEETLCKMLTEKYARDGVSAEFYVENNENIIAIFGSSSPLLKSEISGFILAHLPETSHLIQIQFAPDMPEVKQPIESLKMRVFTRLRALLNPLKSV